MRHLVIIVLLLGLGIFLAGCNPLDAKTKAGLQVITGDISASLFLDDQYLEKAPYIGKDIQPGVYTLRIQPDDPDLIPHEVQVTLRKGLLTVVTWRPGARPELSGGVIYEMEKLPNKNQTELAVVTIPDGAIVSIQGREKEFAPLNILNIDPGQKEFEVSLPSYEAQRHTINIVAGHKTTITVKLAKSEMIEINTVSTPINATGSAEIATSSAQVQPSPSPAGNVLGTSSRIASISAQATTASPSPQVGNGAKVTIQPTGYSEDGREVLKVRDASSTNGNVIGVAPVGSEYAYLNETFGGWYKIQFGTQIGWVSGQYAKLSE